MEAGESLVELNKGVCMGEGITRFLVAWPPVRAVTDMGMPIVVSETMLWVSDQSLQIGFFCLFSLELLYAEQN